jgi:lipopolysaccharide/colanic/teichoic acid biosynthesis glycosyltransferase
MNMYQQFGKRFFDFCSSLIGLIILSPVMLMTAIFIKLNDNGPVFFAQERMGKGFEKFKLLKFRTMIVNADKTGEAITKGEDPRITGIGKFLRYDKLDELPQLINVLKGEMSMVGPRPEVEKYVAVFKDQYQQILTIKPGITDYATLQFRNEEEILNEYEDTHEGYMKGVLPAKIELYLKYLNEMNFVTDLKIIFKTLWRIVS